MSCGEGCRVCGEVKNAYHCSQCIPLLGVIFHFQLQKKLQSFCDILRLPAQWEETELALPTLQGTAFMSSYTCVVYLRYDIILIIVGTKY